MKAELMQQPLVNRRKAGQKNAVKRYALRRGWLRSHGQGGKGSNGGLFLARRGLRMRRYKAAELIDTVWFEPQSAVPLAS